MANLKTIAIGGKVLLIATILIYNGKVSAQTFFETAKGDGIINFSGADKKYQSQIKADLTSTALAYGWNYQQISATSKQRLLVNFTAKVKPNDNGSASFINEGKLQSGFNLTGAVGTRFILPGNVFKVLDISFKPEYTYSTFTIYDATRTANGQEPVYKQGKGSFAGNLLVNYLFTPGGFNVYLGAQLGLNFTNNSDDLTKANIETLEPYPGSTTKFVASNVKAVLKGQLENVTTAPLKFDMIFDSGVTLSKSAGMRLGFMGYYRTDIKMDLLKNRIGAGICFLDKANPSKVFTSFGFEFPTFGKGVTTDDQKTNKGAVFASIGYTID